LRPTKPGFSAPVLVGKGNVVWDLDELKIEFEELILADAPIEVSGLTAARN
jgi:hypothetical protein